MALIFISVLWVCTNCPSSTPMTAIKWPVEGTGIKRWVYVFRLFLLIKVLFWKVVRFFFLVLFNVLTRHSGLGKQIFPCPEFRDTFSFSVLKEWIQVIRWWAGVTDGHWHSTQHTHTVTCLQHSLTRSLGTLRSQDQSPRHIHRIRVNQLCLQACPVNPKVNTGPHSFIRTLSSLS